MAVFDILHNINISPGQCIITVLFYSYSIFVCMYLVIIRKFLFILFYFILFYFIKELIDLFIDTNTHTESERPRHRQREKQVPCREPDVGLS